MPTNDYFIENQTGINFRADLNSVLSAIVSNNSSPTEPTTTFAFMWWADMTDSLLKQRNPSNTGWLDILNLNTGGSVSTSINDLVDAIFNTNLENLGLGENALTAATGTRNTAVGVNALKNNTTGFSNVAIGKSALDTNVTGRDNTAIGVDALFSNIDADTNTAIGKAAMFFNTEGFENTAVGYASLYANTVGSGNVAVGFEALTANTTGLNNTALGKEALKANITGLNNTAVGTEVLLLNITGSDNTAVGRAALCLNNSGNYNTALGKGALMLNTTGSDNVAVGKEALLGNTTGIKNVAMGKDTLKANTTGYDNVAVGSSALLNNDTGYGNVALGRNALVDNTTGYHNVAVGQNALANITGFSNTAIGKGAGATATNLNFTITLGENTVPVGTDYITMGKNGGTDRIYNQFTANATWTRVSDERIKKDIETNNVLGLDFIVDLRTVTYKFKAPSELSPEMIEYDKEKDKPSHDKRMFGFIAQEVKETLDNHNIKDFAGWHVDENGKDKLQGISYEMFVMPLVKAVQELSTKNQELMKRVEALENLTK